MDVGADLCFYFYKAVFLMMWLIPQAFSVYCCHHLHFVSIFNLSTTTTANICFLGKINPECGS